MVKVKTIWDKLVYKVKENSDKLVGKIRQAAKERKEWAAAMKENNWRKPKEKQYTWAKDIDLGPIKTRQQAAIEKAWQATWSERVKDSISSPLPIPLPLMPPPIIEVNPTSPNTTWDTLFLLLHYVTRDIGYYLNIAKDKFVEFRQWGANVLDPKTELRLLPGIKGLGLGLGLLSAVETMRADPGDIMPLRIGLAQRNVDLAPGWLLDVSDPKSANFGKHWSAQRVIETFTPSNETVDQVVQWLVDSGIDSERLALTPGYNWLLVHNTTVEEAEVLLNTTYYHYYYPGRDITRIGSEGYNLPESVKKHIDIIIPTTPYEGVQPIPQQVIGPGVTNLDGLAGLDTCQYLITIECLRHLYKFGPGNSSTPGNELGIAQWGDSLGPREDLDLFFNNFTTQPIPQSTAPELIDLNYGGDKENVTDLDIFGYIFGSESALDVQTAYSIVYPQNIRLYQVGADSSEAETRSNFDTLLDFFHTSAVIDGGEAITNVLSFSYLQTEVTLPIEYQRRQCIEWLKLGLQGVSVLFASGDSGVAANRDPLTGQTCLDGERFSPSFPANCPWVTTVGATSLGSKNIDDGEVALDNIPNPFEQADNQYISSGGGFSNVFDQPSYQKKAVSFYLDNYPPPYNNSVYNPSGRGFPDISALGQNISVIVNGNVQRGGGTSASTPIVASLVTLLNEERLAVGKRPIGFLNPILYAHPEAFNDVVEGSNPGCGTEGFRAAKGWDPVTGLGTPNYAKLRKIVLSLP